MAPKSDEETLRALVRLVEHYGSSDYGKVLLHLLRDGRVRLPSPRGPGAPPKWPADEGLELVNAVEHIRAETARDEAAITGKPLGSLKRMSEAAAIEVLQAQFPDKWGSYEPETLRRRHQEVKRHWNYARRLFAHFSQGQCGN